MQMKTNQTITKVAPMNDLVLLRAEQMAQKLQITRRHLDNLVKAGKIPVVRLGKSVRFDGNDVIAALKQTL
jgi:excisionase family DNA binding protein